MKAKTYELLRRCIEDGIEIGWNRAHKHVVTPDPMHIRSEIELHVMNEICEWFTFDEIEDVH